MKIRTDFVTNSSSYSGAEVMIDNPVLLEILARYRDMGVFDVKSFGIKIGSSAFGTEGVPGLYTGNISEDQYSISAVPAIYYDLEEGDVHSPSSLDDMIACIIELIKYADSYQQIDKAALTELEEELIQKKDEIKEGYLKVYWMESTSSNENDDEVDGYVIETRTFLYDRTNGERTIYEKEDSDPDESIEEE